MNIQEIGSWLAVALSSLALLGHAKNFFGSDAKALQSRTEKAEKALVDHDRRIQTVEGELRHMPDRETAHRLELAIERMNGRLDSMTETLKPISATTERLSEILLEQAQK